MNANIDSSRGLAGLAAGALFLLFTLAPGAKAEDREVACSTAPRVGLVGITRRYDPSEAEWRILLQARRVAGVRLLSVGYGEWRNIEKQPGVFKWPDLAPLLRLIAGSKVRLALDLPTPINLDGRAGDLPQGFTFKGFSDPALIARYKALVGAAIEKFGAHLDYITFHTENSEVFVARHPGQRDAFCNFLSAAAAHGRSLAPNIKFANYNTPRHPDGVVRCMARGMDLMGFAAISEFPGAQVNDLASRVEHFAGLAGGRKLAILEAGWPSSRYLGSSRAQQELYVQRMFRLLHNRASDIAFASYYTVFDEDRAIAKQWIAVAFPPPLWTDAQRRAILEWFTSLGLVTIDRQKKPAWEAFVNGVRGQCGESGSHDQD